jgi:hypothetical protein
MIITTIVVVVFLVVFTIVGVIVLFLRVGWRRRRRMRTSLSSLLQ